MKNIQGIKRNRIGTVTSIETEGLTVTFSANDAKRLAEVIMTCPLDALNAQDPQQADKKAKKANAAEEQPVADGVEWKSYDEAAVQLAVKHHMTCFLEQLRIQHSPTHTMVAIREAPYLMVAKEELQPLALRIIPKTHALRLAAEGENADVTVDFKGGGATVRFTRVEEQDNGFRLDGATLILDPHDLIAFSSV